MTLSAKLFFGLMLVLLGCLFGLSCVIGDSNHSVGMLLPTAVIGGLLAWGITALLSCTLKRPFGVIDGVRCTGWMLIGYSIGMQQIASSYYRYYWPSHVSLALRIAGAGVAIGLATVIVASLAMSAPKAIKPGHCQKCGYDLTGNESGVCPECGERI